MRNQYRRVVSDTESSLEDQLTGVQFDDDEFNVSIEDFSDVKIHIERPDGTTVTDDTTGGVAVQESTEGKVKYDFSNSDLNQQGRYRYEWEVIFGGGGVLTFPGDEMAKIWVREELG
jgi:hypothetical protein